MGVLKDKSSESFSSATYLIAKGAFCSSIHCSYYSCIQFILDLFYENFKLSERQLSDEYWNEKNKGGGEGGLHVFYITKLTETIYHKIGGTESSELNEQLNSLRIKRNKADYSRTAIGEKESNKSLKKAETILAKLIEYSPKIAP
jgi:hypothetical protein